MLCGFLLLFFTGWLVALVADRQRVFNRPR